MNDLFTQGLNLLAQQLSQIKGEEIYRQTSCLNIEEREIIGILQAVKIFPMVTEEMKKQIDQIVSYFEIVGKAKWPRTELTDLGLRVGNRFKGTMDLDNEEDNPQQQIEADQT